MVYGVAMVTAAETASASDVAMDTDRLSADNAQLLLVLLHMHTCVIGQSLEFVFEISSFLV